MKIELNIFTKIIILVLVLLSPVLFLYSYSNYKSIHVVQDEIKISNLNRLTFFSSQMDASVNQLSTILNTLSTDTSIIELAFADLTLYNNYYNLVETEKRIEEKLRLLSLTSDWYNKVSIYAPGTKKMISSDRTATYNEYYLRTHISPIWKYYPDPDGYIQNGRFIRFITNPFQYKDITDAVTILEVSFSADNIINMLDQFKVGGKGDPFLYHSDKEIIVNKTSNVRLVNELANRFRPMDGKSSEIVKIGEKEYLVNNIKMKSIDWYLIDYVLLEEILSPITATRNVFYFCISLLLLAGVIASFLLYRHVQVPIRKLIHAVKSMENGDFSVRVSDNQRNEFNYLFLRFNQLTEQIQRLIKDVYEEKIRSREATLKQLQSQINPHFLYNCFAYIKSMTQLGEKDSVIAMVSSLSKYYRYTTRVENSISTLQEEIDLVKNYLVIQNLQMERIQYEINVADEMLDLPMPRLLLQPIVENALVHGIEPRSGIGRIIVVGYKEGERNRLIVEDNGRGLAPECLEALNCKLSKPMDEQMGCGIWNVHQRLMHQFGAGAGLFISHSKLGGLRVELRWDVQEEASHVSSTNCR